MRKALTAILMASAFAAPALSQAADQRVEEARALVKSFGGSLKQALKQAIENGGVVNGIAACNTLAPEIAAQNSKGNWHIGRTSLKLRNPDNAPSDWQEMQLQAMDKQPVVNGKPVEVWQVSDAVGQPEFQYMSAIPTQKLCLNCHGSDIKPDVQAKINELYPQDQATGFSEGDLRGAFVVTYRPAED
ncbi:Tll0287-like domain-containing protein [Marinobacter persicus]|uniref:Uncharacterized protein DUF3365 n=1 Tax=Marinobacter persicus TaxID=930118 RepID=A0A2S6G6S6_9GAMM|nr:DUF3365 domain-containing protein [Marinobacter persicus]PPK51631.1 uncharacterized protein DUF3365 [Marinobacter persicus]PPK54851.1 uncharacterized protein DUF3365 [Marinobacter persicus]PPK58569.1 uncharacterized protein DUF3365 [Marinobacter persicus]